MLFVGGDRVYGPQNAPMLWRRIIAGTVERFEGHTSYQLPQKAYPLAREVVPDNYDASAREIVPRASRGSLGDHIWLRRPWSGWLWPRPLLTIAPQGGTPTNWGSTESFF